MDTERIPKKIGLRGIRRPAWVCSNVNQRVFLIRDRSGSMKGPKATDASAATIEFLAELAKPANKDAFFLGVGDYDDTAEVIQPLEKATRIQGVRPIETRGNTNIDAGLRLAHTIFLAAGKNPEPEGPTFLRSVAILLTDGKPTVGPHPVDAAIALKKVADLVTIAYGADADEVLLADLASSPDHFRRINTGAELRKFLAEVGATLSASLLSGDNAGESIARLNITSDNAFKFDA